jgi:hypothetical protein
MKFFARARVEADQDERNPNVGGNEAQLGAGNKQRIEEP